MTEHIRVRGMMIALLRLELTNGSPNSAKAKTRRSYMKKFTVILLSLLILMATVVPSFAQTRHRSRFGRKARTAAIIAGGAGAGALIAGKKGAAIGGGSAGLYAFNRGAARRHFKHRTRTVGTVASGTALGAGVGGAAGHGKGAAIGAAVGAGSSYLYTRTRHGRRRY